MQLAPTQVTASGAKATKPLRDRLCMIDDLLKDTDRQYSMLIDLYLEQNIPKEMYLECKAHLDIRQPELQDEKADVLARLEISALSDQEVGEIEAFCASST
jgi:hypothetical protein